MRLQIQGAYALYIHCPVASAGRLLRTLSRKIRRKKSRFEQKTSLPKKTVWRLPVHYSAPRLSSLKKRNGNITISELGILAALAAKCPGNNTLFEIGTFDGRTTLNLALNAPVACKIVTLDLPKESDTRFALAVGEQHMVEKNSSGGLFNNTDHLKPTEQMRIEQKFGDSSAFDFSPYYKQCGLFFVDGSHSYECAKKDSFNALRCAAPSGWIVWHDYGVWEGVTKALEEIEAEMNLGLVHIAGTSLVIWKCSNSDHLSKRPKAEKTAATLAPRAAETSASDTGIDQTAQPGPPPRPPSETGSYAALAASAP